MSIKRMVYMNAYCVLVVPHHVHLTGGIPTNILDPLYCCKLIGRIDYIVI